MRVVALAAFVAVIAALASATELAPLGVNQDCDFTAAVNRCGAYATKGSRCLLWQCLESGCPTAFVREAREKLCSMPQPAVAATATTRDMALLGDDRKHAKAHHKAHPKPNKPAHHKAAHHKFGNRRPP